MQNKIFLRPSAIRWKVQVLILWKMQAHEKIKSRQRISIKQYYNLKNYPRMHRVNQIWAWQSQNLPRGSKDFHTSKKKSLHVFRELVQSPTARYVGMWKDVSHDFNASKMKRTGLQTTEKRSKNLTAIGLNQLQLGRVRSAVTQQKRIRFGLQIWSSWVQAGVSW